MRVNSGNMFENSHYTFLIILSVQNPLQQEKYRCIYYLKNLLFICQFLILVCSLLNFETMQ